jgi:Zn finger protein HypA/HybF involved in hydrogenase expression
MPTEPPEFECQGCGKIFTSTYRVEGKIVCPKCRSKIERLGDSERDDLGELFTGR